MLNPNSKESSLPALQILKPVFAICRMDPHKPEPAWLSKDDFYFIARTGDELSIICKEDSILSHEDKTVKVEKDWRCIKVLGPLDFSLTGIMHQLISPLAQEKISVMAQSTFDTDYIFVQANNLEKTVSLLQAVGYDVIDSVDK